MNHQRQSSSKTFSRPFSPPSPALLVPLAALSLAALCFAFYAPTLHYYFQFDDLANITKYFAIRHATFAKLFMDGSRWISYWINGLFFQWSRFNPFIYRLCNIITHISTGLLAFTVTHTLLSRLRRSSFVQEHALPISFITSLLFLLHPVQTQTVSYVIQGQLEGISGLCIMALVALFITYCDARTAVTRGLILAAMGAVTIIGCGTKETIFVAPLLIALVDWFFIAQGNRKEFLRRLWIPASMLSLMLAIYLVVYRWNVVAEVVTFKTDKPNNIGNILTAAAGQRITPYHFCISQFKVVFHYLWMFIWPSHISVDYDWKLVSGFWAPDCIFPLLGLIALGAGLLKILQRNTTSLICFCAGWFLIYIAPRTSIIASTEIMADYKTYVGAYGIYLLMAWGMTSLYASVAERNNACGRLLKKPVSPYAALALLALALGTLTYRRNKVWSDAEIFWEDVIAHAPNKARAYNNYGVHIAENKRDYHRAIPLFKKAIALDAHYPDPRNNLGVAYANVDQVDLAIKTILDAIAINKLVPEHYNNLGNFSLRKKDYQVAEASFLQALRLRPHYGKAYFSLGRLHIAQNNLEEAYANFKKACSCADFDTEHGFFFFGIACMRTQRFDEAIAAFHKTLMHMPTYPLVYSNMGSCYFMKGEYQKALELFEQAIKNDGPQPKLLMHKAETLMQLGQYRAAGDLLASLRPHVQELPLVYIHLATCLINLDRLKEAHDLLQGLLALEGYPAEHKNIALQMLSTFQRVPASPAQAAPAAEKGVRIHRQQERKKR